MSFLDKIVAAITPPESDEDRREARDKAQRLAKPGDWLSHALEHHRRIEACFELALGANSVAERRAALRDLSMVLTAHANAEEAVLYPAMANESSKASAGMAYEEHAMTRIQMGALETLDPMGQDWRDKLGHIRGAVLHHVYEEEGSRFPELREAIAPQDDQRLTRRFLEEFDRYMGTQAFEQPRQMAAQIPNDASNQRPPKNWGAADY
ncbi:MAG: hemerythrin domain-containing protein [Novosphingobium sp.]